MNEIRVMESWHVETCARLVKLYVRIGLQFFLNFFRTSAAPPGSKILRFELGAVKKLFLQNKRAAEANLRTTLNIRRAASLVIFF